MFANRPNSRIIRKTEVEEQDSDVRFQTGSRNQAVSRIRIKNMQYNPYLWPNLRNFCVLQEIGIDEHDGHVRFKTGTRNKAFTWS